MSLDPERGAVQYRPRHSQLNLTRAYLRRHEAAPVWRCAPQARERVDRTRWRRRDVENELESLWLELVEGTRAVTAVAQDQAFGRHPGRERADRPLKLQALAPVGDPVEM